MQRAQRRKYHYIYKITRFDGAYYIGLHSTDDLEDGYFGSGKRLWYSINKHGKDKHIKEILEFLPNRESLKNREKELVCKELLEDVLCMNIQLGGGGGFISEEHKIKCILSSNSSPKRNRSLAATRGNITKKKSQFVFFENSTGFLGKRHSVETKLKMKKSKNVGENNSQFNTCWVSNEFETIKIKQDLVESKLKDGYILGRKLKI